MVESRRRLRRHLVLEPLSGRQCDIESYIYLPLLEETRLHAEGEVLLRAGDPRAQPRIAEHFDLYDDACFQTEVTRAALGRGRRCAGSSTNRGDAIKARFVVMANGPLNRPKLPGIPGIETFKGHTFHTSRWDYDYTGGDSQRRT
jgi:hypothetical protein